MVFFTQSGTLGGYHDATDTLPYPCAAPLSAVRFRLVESSEKGIRCEAAPLVLSDSRAALSAADSRVMEATLDRTFAAVQDLMLPAPAQLQKTKGPTVAWTPVDFHDPHTKVNYAALYAQKTRTPRPSLPAFSEMNALRLQSLPHVGGYHLTRADFVLLHTRPEDFLRLVHSKNEAQRQQFTPAMRRYVRWLTNPSLLSSSSEENMEENDRLRELALAKDSAHRHWYIESNVFTAPPPVSCREALMVVEKRYCAAEGCFYIYGCSVDGAEGTHPSRATPRRNAAYQADVYLFQSCARAVYMFGWRLAFDVASGHTHATMVSVMNPGGWMPSFLLALFKTEVGREVAYMRKTLYAVMQAEKKQDTSVMQVEATGVQQRHQGEDLELPPEPPSSTAEPSLSRAKDSKHHASASFTAEEDGGLSLTHSSRTHSRTTSMETGSHFSVTPPPVTVVFAPQFDSGKGNIASAVATARKLRKDRMRREGKRLMLQCEEEELEIYF